MDSVCILTGGGYLAVFENEETAKIAAKIISIKDGPFEARTENFVVNESWDNFDYRKSESEQMVGAG